MAEDPALSVSLTGFSDLADKEGFAVVYPHGWEYANAEGFFPLGVGFTWNAGACCPKACAKKTDDVQFMKDLLTYVKGHISELSGGTFAVDATRVYLSGASNGAFMTNRIGCQAPDLFAAIAPASGMIVDGSSKVWGSDPYDCPTLAKPLPALYFHGTLDPLVPWTGNDLLGFPSVESYVKRMQKRNGIVGDNGTVTYKHGDVTCTAYGDVASNYTFCEHHNQHCWPGRTTQGPCTTNIDATSQIWAFFKNYRLSSDAGINTMVV
jgi:polyhydroxybutyrate depolymerase